MICVLLQTDTKCRCRSRFPGECNQGYSPRTTSVFWQCFRIVNLQACIWSLRMRCDCPSRRVPRSLVRSLFRVRRAMHSRRALNWQKRESSWRRHTVWPRHLSWWVPSFVHELKDWLWRHALKRHWPVRMKPCWSIAIWDVAWTTAELIQEHNVSTLELYIYTYSCIWFFKWINYNLSWPKSDFEAQLACLPSKADSQHRA